MMSQQQNDLITLTGPGTACGKLMRMYWQPAALVDELEGERPIKPVTLLGEKLVLFRDESGRYAVKFLDMPWANGAVWSLNPSPNLRGESTGASLLWSPAIKAKVYDNNPAGKVDGEYLDSLEGYVTANLNFDRSHWAKAIASLTFSTGSRTPAQHKALLVYEYTRWMSAQLQRWMAARSARRPGPRQDGGDGLTAREHEVLVHVGRGKSSREIGQALFLSEATVKSHLVHIFTKLGVGSRTAAVARARELGAIRAG